MNKRFLNNRFVLRALKVLGGQNAMRFCCVAFVWIAFWITNAYGQGGDGTAGIMKATSMVSSYFDPAVKLIYAIGAVVGLIGAIKVYNKFSSGDPDTSKTAASWFGACIFLIVAATILSSFFM